MKLKKGVLISISSLVLIITLSIIFNTSVAADTQVDDAATNGQGTDTGTNDGSFDGYGSINYFNMELNEIWAEGANPFLNAEDVDDANDNAGFISSTLASLINLISSAAETLFELHDVTDVVFQKKMDGLELTYNDAPGYYLDQIGLLKGLNLNSSSYDTAFRTIIPKSSIFFFVGKLYYTMFAFLRIILFISVIIVGVLILLNSVNSKGLLLLRQYGTNFLIALFSLYFGIYGIKLFLLLNMELVKFAYRMMPAGLRSLELGHFFTLANPDNWVYALVALGAIFFSASMTFQYTVRWILFVAHIGFMPIVMITSLIPGNQSYRKEYFTEVGANIFTQTGHAFALMTTMFMISIYPNIFVLGAGLMMLNQLSTFIRNALGLRTFDNKNALGFMGNTMALAGGLAMAGMVSRGVMGMRGNSSGRKKNKGDQDVSASSMLSESTTGSGNGSLGVMDAVKYKKPEKNHVLRDGALGFAKGVAKASTIGAGATTGGIISAAMGQNASMGIMAGGMAANGAFGLTESLHKKGTEAGNYISEKNKDRKIAKQLKDGPDRETLTDVQKAVLDNDAYNADYNKNSARTRAEIQFANASPEIRNRAVRVAGEVANKNIKKAEKATKALEKIEDKQVGQIMKRDQALQNKNIKKVNNAEKSIAKSQKKIDMVEDYRIAQETARIENAIGETPRNIKVEDAQLNTKEKVFLDSVQRTQGKMNAYPIGSDEHNEAKGQYQDASERVRNIRKNRDLLHNESRQNADLTPNYLRESAIHSVKSRYEMKTGYAN